MLPKSPFSVCRYSAKSAAIDPQQFEACEPRIALSASAASAWWEAILGDLGEGQSPEVQTPEVQMHAIEQDNSVANLGFSTDEPSSANAAAAPDLFAQAKQIRERTGSSETGLTGGGLAGGGQTAVLIDTGIAPDHVALGGVNRFGPGERVVGGYDFAENDYEPYDDGPAGFHGTHVASLLGGNQSDGFQGIAPEVDLVSLRVFDDQGASQLQWIESALQWVHENKDAFDSPITTVNLSIGVGLDAVSSAEAASVLSDELAQLRQDDILVFAASGNFYDSGQAESAVYPASDPNVFGVSSIDTDGNLSDFSQRPEGALAAVGRGVDGAVPEHVFGWDGNVNDFATLDGSSMATPQVAGASILIRQALQDAGLPASGDDVLTALTQGAKQSVDPQSGSTFSSIDLDGSLRWIAENLIDPSSTIDTGQADGLNFEGSSNNLLDLADLSRLRPDADGVYRLDGGDGADSLSIVGGPANERYILRAGADQTSEIVFGDTKFELTGFEQFTVDGSVGDRVSMFDSRGNDTLRTSGDQTTLEGIGFAIEVRGVRQIYVHATGGVDRAFLSDTAGDDALVVRPEFTSMRSNGIDGSGEGEMFRLAFGFDDVSVASTAGGHDRVDIYDSVGDDTLSLSPGRSVLVGTGYKVSATGFDETSARAANPGNPSIGGNDTVRVYLDDPDDLLRDNTQPGSIGIRAAASRASAAIRAEGFENELAFVDYQPLDLADWIDRRQR